MSKPKDTNPNRPVIQIRRLKKYYKVGEEIVRALDGVDLDIHNNEFVAIMGASGSGKSTLMNILGCLDKPTNGAYVLNNKPTHKLGMSALARVRNEEIGFIFQTFELLNRASALRNVMLPMLYSKKHLFSARRRAKDALKLVGLDDLDCCFRIKVPGGFVGEEDRRIIDEGASDRNALALTT